LTTRDPTDLRSQERDAESDELVAREKRRKELEDIKWLMAHPQGRRFVSRLLEEAGVNRTSFNHSGSVMAFSEGKRHIGLFLTAEVLQAAPEGYFKLLKEYQAKNDD
jgi:hypothetical protein